MLAFNRRGLAWALSEYHQKLGDGRFLSEENKKEGVVLSLVVFGIKYVQQSL